MIKVQMFDTEFIFVKFGSGSLVYKCNYYDNDRQYDLLIVFRSYLFIRD